MKIILKYLKYLFKVTLFDVKENLKEINYRLEKEINYLKKGEKIND